MGVAFLFSGCSWSLSYLLCFLCLHRPCLLAHVSFCVCQGEDSMARICAAHRAGGEDTSGDNGSRRGRQSIKRSAAAMAVAAVVACASVVGVAIVLMHRGGSTELQQHDTTFVWATPSHTGPAATAAQQSRPVRIAAARGRVQRLAATRRAAGNPEPLGFDIEKTLDTSFRRGETGSASLIHIDLPIEQYQIGKTVGAGKANVLARNIDGTGLPHYLLPISLVPSLSHARLRALSRSLSRSLSLVLSLYSSPCCRVISMALVSFSLFPSLSLSFSLSP